MHFRLKTKLDELGEIQFKLVDHSLNNIKWSCLYSGLGIIKPLTKKEINDLTGYSENHEVIEFYLQNYVPLSCIYESGVPIFAVPSKEILNPGKFMWEDKHHKKILAIEAQAYAIISLCYSIEMINQDNKFENYMLKKTAKMIYDFVSTYLRNDDGLYIDGVDKSKLTDKQKKIKLEEKNLKPVNQVLMLEALLFLNRISKGENLSKLDIEQDSWSKFDNYTLEIDNLFHYIDADINSYLDLSTKELSNTISSLYRSYSIMCLELVKPNLQIMITKLCAELSSRVKISGEIEKDCINTENASIITHFKASSALLEGYSLTGFETFKESSIRMYKALIDLYDSNFKLFHDCNISHVKYSIADITDIIKALLLNYKFTNNTSAIAIIKELYFSLLESTGMIQSTIKNSIENNNSDSDSDNDNDKDKEEDYELMMKNDILMDMYDIGKAPVFMKNIKIELTECGIELKASKYFNSHYSLYSSYTLLYYLNMV